MLIRILSLFYQNIKKNVSLLEDEYYYDDHPYDYDDMYDVYDFDDILIKLRTMPILMISTMTIMMIYYVPYSHKKVWQTHLCGSLRCLYRARREKEAYSPYCPFLYARNRIYLYRS